MNSMSRPAGEAKKVESPGAHCGHCSSRCQCCRWQKYWLTFACSGGQVRSRRKNRGSQTKPGHLVPSEPLWGQGCNCHLASQQPRSRRKPCPSEGPCSSLLRPGHHPAGPRLSTLPPGATPTAGLAARGVPRHGLESQRLTHEVRAQDELLQQREALLELVGAYVHGHAARPRAPSGPRAATRFRRAAALKGSLPPPRAHTCPPRASAWRRRRATLVTCPTPGV